MRRAMQKAALLALGVVTVFSSSGCLRGIVTDARIAEARASAEALETLGDADVARAGTEAQLAELEGLYRLSPQDDDILFALVRAWTVYGAVFLQDTRESLEPSNEPLAEASLANAEQAYQKERHALERAAGFGLSALAKKGSGLDEARRTRDGFSRWAEDHLSGQRDGELAYWVGRAWLSRSRLGKGDPHGRSFEAFVGTVLLERSSRIAPGYARYGAATALAGAQAETRDGLDEARRSFELLLEKTQKKALSVQVEYALRVACVSGDALLYERLLNDVLGAVDPGLDERLANVFAKRKARRALSREAMKACKFATKPEAAP
jgi:hypothetical protein